ncbi:DUF1801 domain-containing protein [Demequina flava]|uniref:DUF1801 domain-containing protein n=1 Tax=Demequina flava TaxID=1095025 RepID=UPI000783C372|nr:DUF1801 domain-containing protein [Demequina flava]
MEQPDSTAPVPPVPAAIEAVIADYSDDVRARILELRELVWHVAATDPGVGELHETLKWGQPSYLTTSPRTGTTVRIDRVKGSNDVAIFTHCQTSLVGECRAEHGEVFDYDGTRAVIVRAPEPVPEAELRDHVAEALLYHRR